MRYRFTRITIKTNVIREAAKRITTLQLSLFHPLFLFFFFAPFYLHFFLIPIFSFLDIIHDSSTPTNHEGPL